MKFFNALGKGIYWTFWGLFVGLIKFFTVVIPVVVKWTGIGLYKAVTVGLPFLLAKGVPWLLTKALPWLIVKGIPYLFIGLGLAIKWTAIGLYKGVTVGLPWLVTVGLPYVLAELVPLVFSKLFKVLVMFLKSIPVLVKEIYQMLANTLTLKIVLGIGPIIAALTLLGNGHDAYVLTGLFLYMGLYTVGLTKVKEALYLVIPGLVLSVGMMF